MNNPVINGLLVLSAIVAMMHAGWIIRNWLMARNLVRRLDQKTDAEWQADQDREWAADEALDRIVEHPLPNADLQPAPGWQDPVCPACGSIMFIKTGRTANGNCRVHCFDCGEESLLTNREYYGWD